MEFKFVSFIYVLHLITVSYYIFILCYLWWYYANRLDDYNFSEVKLVELPTGTETASRVEEVMEVEPEPEKPTEEDEQVALFVFVGLFHHRI